MVDTTVVVAGLVWPRFSYEVLQHARSGDFVLWLSRIVIVEARRTLNHRFPSFSLALEEFLATVPIVYAPNPDADEVEKNFTLMRDINDIPIALSAIKSEVDYFVTEDKDYTAPNQPIQAHLRVRLPGRFLNEVMGWSHDDLERIRRRTWSDVR
jgi:putative PIN family toxin of toxin-antitoxin system